MLQTDRLAPALDAPFVVALARPCKAGLKEIMRRQGRKAFGQHPLGPNDFADGGRQIVIGNALRYATEIGKGPHMRIQERQLIAALIEPHIIIAGVHEVHEELPGMPLLPALIDHHIKKVNLR